MQTTIQLDDALLAQATKLAREKGCDLSHLIEETLRDKIAPTLSVVPRPPFRLTTVGGEAVRPGVDPIASAALLTAMDDPLKNLKPLTPEESRRCFATPDPEFDALAAHCAALPVPIPED